MTDRDITGDAKANMSAYRKAQAIAKERGLLDSDLRAIADGVREFDAQRSTEVRSTAALEKIAENTTPPRSSGDPWVYEQRRLRRREVAAQELAALAALVDEEELEQIRAGATYRRMFERVIRTEVTPDSM